MCWLTYVTNYQEYQSPIYLVALFSSVLASSLDGLFPPGSQFHNQQLHAYILLALQPKGKSAFPPGVLQDVLKRVLTGPRWVMWSSLSKFCGQEGAALWLVGSGSRDDGSSHETHRLRVKTRWHSQKRREWTLGRQNPARCPFTG